MAWRRTFQDGLEWIKARMEAVNPATLARVRGRLNVDAYSIWLRGVRGVREQAVHDLLSEVVGMNWRDYQRASRKNRASVKSATEKFPLFDGVTDRPPNCSSNGADGIFWNPMTARNR